MEQFDNSRSILNEYRCCFLWTYFLPIEQKSLCNSIRLIHKKPSVERFIYECYESPNLFPKSISFRNRNCISTPLQKLNMNFGKKSQYKSIFVQKTMKRKGY